jgi:chromosome segregation and condensation protein ScpB
MEVLYKRPVLRAEIMWYRHSSSEEPISTFTLRS